MTSTVTAQKADFESRNWFLFKVKTGKEPAVLRSLRLRGIHAEMPEVSYSIRRKHRKAREIRKYPALKSYLLVSFERGVVPFREVLDAPFVHGVVGFGGFASCLDGGQVYDFLHNPKLDRTGLSVPKTFKPEFAVDDVVTLRGAGFDGIEGDVVGIDVKLRRARISIQLLGSQREIDVPVDCVSKAA